MKYVTADDLLEHFDQALYLMTAHLIRLAYKLSVKNMAWLIQPNFGIRQ